MVETTIDGKKAYDLNPVRMLFDEISTLINEHSREELEGQLAALTKNKRSYPQSTTQIRCQRFASSS